MLMLTIWTYKHLVNILMIIILWFENNQEFTDQTVVKSSVNNTVHTCTCTFVILNKDFSYETECT